MGEWYLFMFVFYVCVKVFSLEEGEVTSCGCMDKYVSKWCLLKKSRVKAPSLGTSLTFFSGSDKTFKPDTEQSQ